MAMRRLKKEGKLQDQENQDEINACSIVVPIKVDGVEEEWLINFKMKRIIIRRKSNRLAARLHVLAVRFEIRCQVVHMYIRQ